ncbi:glycoside hydrolase family 3 protein [Hydnomerulius pinastri MD-312]|uniref:beta-glucosidase n=1 Tax=Hydnomerulius pinastri MD-312 TaxID=994086 RepID=A0A0C9W4N5_9AGAM|nr:glycoside hydrolase family 3 protein [Hydnomerulius pinastri MD-312]
MVSNKLFALLCLLPAVLGAHSSSATTSVPTTSGAKPSSAVPTTSSVPSTTSASSSSVSSVSSSSTSVVSSAPPTSASSSPATSETGVISIPLSSYPFTPYPTPTLPAYPPVFPATDPLNPPEVSNDPQVIPDFAPAWAAAYDKAKKLIADYTIEDKVNITTGVGWMGGLCVGNIPANKGFPGLCLEDSPLGVRDTDYNTAFPAAIQAASTWNRALIRARGLAMGQEFKGKGVHVALGPMMNMGRIAQGGRNWEGFGADPFLAGEGAYETILGLQQGGVQATAKHFIGNEQEHFRTQESSNIDDRTMHEIYAHPFLRSVMAGVASVMCSYNLLNDTYACNNDKTMNDILKREFGFQGFIQSDWQATMATLSAVAGLDMTMPGDVTFNSGDSYFGGNLTSYVNNGYISMERLDDMATRIIAGWYFLHQDSGYPEVSFNAFNLNDEVNNKHVNVQADHYKIVREVGTQGTVLLKNQNGALPLHKPRNMILVGSDARLGMSGPNEFSDQGGSDGILAMGWGSGTANFPYLVSPMEAINERARQDGSSLSYNFDDWNLEQAGNLAVGQAVALVFINSDSGEDYITVDGNEGDRKNLTAWHNGDNLVQAVAAQNNNTIVVVNSVGPLILEPWIENPNITAVVWAGIQGQEAGNSIADILYGDYNPSGRLPYTIAKNPADYPAQLVTGGSGSEILIIDYTEGLNIDYRHFDAAGIEPRFEFGFGLSYTTFKYSNLEISTIKSQDNAQKDLVDAWSNGQASPIAEGSSTALWLHEPAFKVTFNVKNTGSVSGTEIPQLYIQHSADAGEPPSILKGFTNVSVDPGKTQKVSITLSRHDVSIWDVAAQGWRKPSGKISFAIGASSRDFRLQGVIPA